MLRVGMGTGAVAVPLLLQQAGASRRSLPAGTAPLHSTWLGAYRGAVALRLATRLGMGLPWAKL